MKCGNCGTDLIPGNNTCPSCGALNMPNPVPEQPSPQVENLENVLNPVQQVAAQTEAPTLTVNSETLESDTAPIQDTPDTETYETLDEGTPAANNQSEDLKIDIPAQTDAAPVQVDQNVQAGGIATVEAEKGTIGNDIVVPEKNVTFKIGGKTLKVNLGKANIQKMIIFAAVFFLGLFLGYLMFGNKTVTKCYKAPNNSKSIISNGKKNETYINGFKYKIPDSYVYDKTNTGVVIYSPDLTYKIYLKSIVFQYDKIANAKLSLQQTFIDNGFAVDNIKELSINDHSYTVITTTIGMTNRMIALTDVGNNKVFYVEIITDDNKFNTELLNEADTIIRSVEATNDATQIEKIDIRDLSQLITDTVNHDSDIKRK